MVSDALPGLGTDLSVVWTASTSDARSTGLWDMNRAGSVAEFDRAVRGFSQPHQNVVFASVDGRIGYRLGGRVPVRGEWDGSVPVPADHGQAPPGHGQIPSVGRKLETAGVGGFRTGRIFRSAIPPS